MKKILLVVIFVLLFAFLPAIAEEQKTQPAAKKSGFEPWPVKTYTLHYVSPKFIKESLGIYLYNCSFGEGSNLISVAMDKKDVAAFEEQLRKLDVPKKNIMLRIFTVIASKEGKSEAIENKELKRVLAEVSNLLSFKSYALDGVSVITLKDGTKRGSLLLSAAVLDLMLHINQIAILTDSNGKRSIKLGLDLWQGDPQGSLMDTETEIAENGYLVAGVSRIGKDGKSLVLVINAEIK